MENQPDTATQVEPGSVDIAGVFNARQVGTLAADPKRLRKQIVIRSGDLRDLTDIGCATLDTLHVSTIIDLRDEPDLSDRPDRDCGSPTRRSVLVSLPKLLPPNADNYLATLDAAEPKLPSLFSTLSQTQGSVLIHCVIGRDRATIITSLVLLALGVDEATMLANATSNQDSSVTVDASWFTTVLDRIHNAGGVEAYLTRLGVTGDQLAALRVAMTE
jgi:protein-tyrosine phosphatase